MNDVITFEFIDLDANRDGIRPQDVADIGKALDRALRQWVSLEGWLDLRLVAVARGSIKLDFKAFIKKVEEGARKELNEKPISAAAAILRLGESLVVIVGMMLVMGYAQPVEPMDNQSVETAKAEARKGGELGRKPIEELCKIVVRMDAGRVIVRAAGCPSILIDSSRASRWSQALLAPQRTLRMQPNSRTTLTGDAFDIRSSPVNVEFEREPRAASIGRMRIRDDAGDLVYLDAILVWPAEIEPPAMGSAVNATGYLTNDPSGLDLSEPARGMLSGKFEVFVMITSFRHL